jgi:hypothetical protein
MKEAAEALRANRLDDRNSKSSNSNNNKNKHVCLWNESGDSDSESKLERIVVIQYSARNVTHTPPPPPSPPPLSPTLPCALAEKTNAAFV